MRYLFKFVLFILFVLSGSAVYMGVANVFRCPASSETPIQVLIIGILACIVIILRMVNLKFQSNADLPAKSIFMVVTALSAIATFSFFLAHMITFLNISVDFDSSSESVLQQDILRLYLLHEFRGSCHLVYSTNFTYSLRQVRIGTS
ncbi:hypothetical protein TNIN_477412 [Trichonephila inaurata madagascariensis]|uniref:Uncharacterized protein n=1 Tax=Trichonephila inaurata madagascariensis TaxID=2747483 RepID=A0A8X6XVK3_9ARAC|nr:hypothetical protein TNIN_477412 [Trichonephila inaurata madagascariensis]